MKRFRQVIHYGKIHAKEIADKNGLRWLPIFIDILYCYKKYNMWSNQYLKEKFWDIPKSDRNKIGQIYYENGKRRDEWTKGFLKTHSFLYKWASRKWCCSLNKRNKRTQAYIRYYNMGQQCFVDHNVELQSQHHLDGSINVGNHVTFAKHVCIDYSGGVVIEDGVDIMDGVHIITHDHKFQHSAIAHHKSSNVTACPLKICTGAAIGSKAIIMPSCNYIGKYARVGAGAVVTKDVPDYAVVLGVPAQVKRYLEESEEQ